MKIIGLTGGIGSGKTTIALFLENRYNAPIIDADEIAHYTILRGEPAYNEIIEKFSDNILDANGEIDREKLGDIVFADKEKLEILANITHPHIIGEICRKAETAKSIEAAGGYAVLDVPLLIETRLHTICDYVIVANAPEQVRVERICKRDNTNTEKAMRIINSQMAFERLREYADFCIDTDCDMKQLEERIVECMLKIEEGVSGLKHDC